MAVCTIAPSRWLDEFGVFVATSVSIKTWFHSSTWLRGAQSWASAVLDWIALPARKAQAPSQAAAATLGILDVIGFSFHVLGFG
jgi:hypothetical protein